MGSAQQRHLCLRIKYVRVVLVEEGMAHDENQIAVSDMPPKLWIVPIVRARAREFLFCVSHCNAYQMHIARRNL